MNRSRWRIALPAAAALSDAGALLFGAWAAYALRFSEFVTARIPVVNEMPPAGWYSRLALILAAVYAVLAVSGGLYRLPRPSNWFDDTAEALKRFIFAWTLLLAGIFFYRVASFSRLTLLMLLVLDVMALWLARWLWMSLRQWLYRQGFATRRAAVAGRGPQSERIINQIVANPQYGLTLAGVIGDFDAPSPLPVLGDYSQTGQIVRRHNLDAVIVAGSSAQSELIGKLVRACYGVNVNFLYLPDIDLPGGGPRRIVEVGGIPLWALKETPFAGWPGLVKRTFDLCTSLCILIVLAPIMLTLAVIVKLTSQGPVLYRQRRVGMDGREFNCLKFRSMRVGAEDRTGVVWAKPGDARVTPFGRFMRRFSLDELPQLWNIVRGDMSLVGPRPERPEFVSQFERHLDGYQERHRMRAGLTGWAQVNGLRGNTSIEERTKFDRYYVENWSLLLDLKILLMTILAVVKGDNSY